jgi:hypothetical protein
MSNLTRDIGTEDLKIEEVVKLLREDKYLIPTFQREFVWQPANILKLWDSMFRFYPIGSILYWETDSYLHTHRQIGGFVFPHDEDTVKKFKEWKYVLDGQQRCTSLLVCMLGGKGRVEDNEDFDYTLYFDATTAEFFFADQFEKRRNAVADAAFLVRVRDVPTWGFTFYKDVSAVEGFTPDIEHNLQQLQRMSPVAATARRTRTETRPERVQRRKGSGDHLGSAIGGAQMVEQASRRTGEQ